MAKRSKRIDLIGHNGGKLSANLDLPIGNPKAYAIFAHCFTCSKNFSATRHISASLAEQGIAVLRFDFTGLGSSEGDFASTNFSSNVEDLILAADHLRDNYKAPALMIGHSLGGAATLVAAGSVPEVMAVVTIGAPADANHVTHNFEADLSKIKCDGKAEVNLGGRKFTIEKQFLEDLAASSVESHTANLKKPLLVMHSPIDQTVGIENAQNIFIAAKHPKSFISLDQADHLLSKKQDSDYVAKTIAAWSARYLPEAEVILNESEGVLVRETGKGRFQNEVIVGQHNQLADEPTSYGGTNTGPTPYEYVAAGLGACTNMTLRLYTQRKGWDIGEFSVVVSHNKIHVQECETCDDEAKAKGGKVDVFHRTITVPQDVDPEIANKLLVIADKCPVHRTLHNKSTVSSELVFK